MSDQAGINQAIADFAAGRPVLVVDDEDRENEGDLIFAADRATPALMAFVVKYTSGFVCVALTEERCARLNLPPMFHTSQDRHNTAYRVTVDARNGTTTGISASDRAVTARRLADPRADADSFCRPGHVVPLQARSGGVLERSGHTEAAVDLAMLAGVSPAGVLCEVVSSRNPVQMARRGELEDFSAWHGLSLISIADLMEHRKRREPAVERVAEARVPTAAGEFTAVGFAGTDGAEHIAFVMGDVRDRDDVLVRIHSECLTGDVFGSLRCDCGDQLQNALDAVSREGVGVVVYLRGHEGRGLGLLRKLQAYRLQEDGLDTVDANLALGARVDGRDYRDGAHIVRELGVRSIRLLTNNPAKRCGMEHFEVRVAGVVALPVEPNPENSRYLQTKRDRLGHDIRVPECTNRPETQRLPTTGS